MANYANPIYRSQFDLRPLGSERASDTYARTQAVPSQPLPPPQQAQQQQTISQLMAQADPFASQRGQYQTQLRDLLTNPSTALESNPFFKASGEAGQEAAMRRLRQMGMGTSGNAAFELQRQAQANMSGGFFKLSDLLGRFSGANADPAAAANAAINTMGLFEKQRQFDQGPERRRYGQVMSSTGQQVSSALPEYSYGGLSSLGSYWGQ